MIIYREIFLRSEARVSVFCVVGMQLAFGQGFTFIFNNS